MKKLILVMVFVLLTALFIAFNYLLLDRENREKELKNLEDVNAGNNATISAQKREIDSLVEENGSLRDKNDQLQSEKDQLTRDISVLTSDKDKLSKTLQERVNFNNILKQYADIKALSEPVTKWVEALDQGKYEEAFKLEYAGVLEQDRTLNLTSYIEEMKNTVSKIEITEVKLDNFRGGSTGDIFLDVRLNVKLAENVNKASARYTEGVNDKSIKIDYSIEEKKFIISEINNL